MRDVRRQRNQDKASGSRIKLYWCVSLIDKPGENPGTVAPLWRGVCLQTWKTCQPLKLRLEQSGQETLGRSRTDDESKSEELPVKKVAVRRRLTANDGLLIGENFYTMHEKTNSPDSLFAWEIRAFTIPISNRLNSRRPITGWQGDIESAGNGKRRKERGNKKGRPTGKALHGQRIISEAGISCLPIPFMSGGTVKTFIEMELFDR